ncbi:bifunctional [glutamine synthetase] adenylyltransferase/[glutamine synthetase]-adenylyl-L-tyrosine phosphorylase [Actinotignum sp. GS-2025b]|uniref:bifunctional [glutamine synthetase] adenylyltransferase/[glutamine synthetase]-adenylyl-L-tyrosine phosphorylase n=1 Tax=Actinotignum sp. GS-2025b TaxID=3427275 RepID=UPI003F46500E
MRRLTLAQRARRCGFTAPERAAAELEAGAWQPEDFAHVADPDRALAACARLGLNRREGVGNDDAARPRLLAVLGLSTALADHLARHPQAARELCGTAEEAEARALLSEADERAAMCAALAPWLAGAVEGTGTGTVTGAGTSPVTGAGPEAGSDSRENRSDLQDAIAALRAHYYTRILTLAGWDLTLPDPAARLPEVAVTLSNLACATLEGALHLARTRVPDANAVDFTIIALGKTGGGELNYASDVDVVYITEPRPGVSEARALEIGTALATTLAGYISAPGPESALWTIDTALRPEGGTGPLVRTLASHLDYYATWAQSWEFQALLKARVAAGNRELGNNYLRATAPLVWNAASRDNFVTDARAMRARVEAHIPTAQRDRHIKLGAGGLRDVEFTVQLLQLVHGRVDTTIRSATTTTALARLSEGGYISRPDAARLDHHYRWLRCLEHRAQLVRLRRAAVLPTREDDLRRLARSLGLPDAAALTDTFAQVRREVRELHQDIFYRPLLPAAAQLAADDISLAPEAARTRLASIGYRDPAGALRHISALTEGTSRRAAIARQLLPVMLGWFAEGPEPDAGLLAFRVLSEKMGATSWYMRTLRDGGPVAHRLALILSRSRFLARDIPELPESIAWLGDDAELAPRSAAALRGELDALLERRSQPGEIAGAGRWLRWREVLRTAMAQALGLLGPEEVAGAVSNAVECAVEAGVRAARCAVVAEKNEADGPHPDFSFAVIGLGSLGGRECGYTSDADVMFVWDGPEEAAGDADALARAFMRLEQEVGGAPPLAVDADMRPEGRSGVLARSLDSYGEYYRNWAEPWEFQALLRARAVGGDRELGERFLELIAPLRYPAHWDESRRTAIRLMKIRVEKERIPGGVAPASHLKLGPGGSADVEWTAQLLQLEYAAAYPQLRVTGTGEALRAAGAAGLITANEEHALVEGWQAASALRQAAFVATGRTGSAAQVIPRDPRERERMAAILGVEHASDILDRRARAARHARAAVEHVFYGRG